LIGPIAACDPADIYPTPVIKNPQKLATTLRPSERRDTVATGPATLHANSRCLSGQHAGLLCVIPKPRPVDAVEYGSRKNTPATRRNHGGSFEYRTSQGRTVQSTNKPPIASAITAQVPVVARAQQVEERIAFGTLVGVELDSV